MTKRFQIVVTEDQIADLRVRLAMTRWPGHAPEPGWVAGAELGTVRRLAAYWADGFDWRQHEAALNSLPQYLTEIEDQRIHYVHLTGGSRVPLILTHGWPSSFVELMPLAHRLHERGYEVVVPSLPGYAFSDPPGTSPAAVPTFELWHRLMLTLGYDRYGAHGGDLGAGITSRLGAAHPESVIGIHLLAVAAATDHQRLSADEQAYLDQLAAWDATEGGYQHQQQTRPLTLAYGLSDSPVGVLAWLVEKYRAWSDCEGDISRRFSDDEILIQVSLYWFTNTIASSFRPYFDYLAHPLGPVGPVRVPTAVAVFPHDLVQPPRAYAERSYHVEQFNTMPRGGHFAAHEEPDLLADDVDTFFGARSRLGNRC